MEILDGESWLSDHEVYWHVKEQKKLREDIALRIGRAVQSSENILTIEFETLEYFENRTKMDVEKMESLLEEMTKLPLTKAEKIQIINNIPKTEVELYLIVEECEERLKEDQIENFLEFISNLTI